jgi:NifU-like protein involved in Fe-S cluster formation
MRVRSDGSADPGRKRAAHYNRRVYSDQLLDHFENPRNVGEVEFPDAAARLENPVCGDILELTAKVEGDRIVDIRFRAKGCVPAMACASAITELVKEKTFAEARRITREDMLREVGGVPEASSHACALAIETLHRMLDKL